MKFSYNAGEIGSVLFKETISKIQHFCENYLWTEDFDEKHVTNTNILMKPMSKIKGYWCQSSQNTGCFLRQVKRQIFS